MTRVIDPNGTVLIEQLSFLPSPGEHVEVKGVKYVITSDVPITKQVDPNAMGHAPFVRFVTARPVEDNKPVAGKVQSSGRRGAAVEG